MKTAMQYLNEAICKVKQHGYTPPQGEIVVETYKLGELQDTEECLYVIAELLSVMLDNKQGGLND